MCLEPCPRTKLGCDHVCKKYCGDPCDPRCEELLRDINVVLPCGHVVKNLRCWQYQAQDTIRCTVLVEKEVTKCQHKVKVQCQVNVNAEDYRCTVPCGRQLECGHFCEYNVSAFDGNIQVINNVKAKLDATNVPIGTAFECTRGAFPYATSPSKAATTSAQRRATLVSLVGRAGNHAKLHAVIRAATSVAESLAIHAPRQTAPPRVRTANGLYILRKITTIFS